MAGRRDAGSGMCEVVQCREWMSGQSEKRQWEEEVAMGVGRGSGSRKWDTSGIVPEGCQKLGLSLVRRGFSKYNEVVCEGFTGLE